MHSRQFGQNISYHSDDSSSAQSGHIMDSVPFQSRSSSPVPPTISPVEETRANIVGPFRNLFDGFWRFLLRVGPFRNLFDGFWRFLLRAVAIFFNQTNARTAHMPVARDESEYTMNHPKRGYAVILHHDSFRNLDPRTGTEVDCKHLKQTLEMLHFEVEIYKNNILSDINKKMKKISKMDHSDSDCLLIAILSYGSMHEHIYAYDRTYQLEDICSHFTANRCPSLAGKPKLFFIQACQYNGRGQTETDGDSKVNYTIPVHADFLIAYSTLPVNYSLQDTRMISFINNVCDVFNRYVKQLDILTMLTFICQRATNDIESYVPEESKTNAKQQIPFITTTLTRTLKFFDNHQTNERCPSEYKMSHSKRGFAIILNQESFKIPDLPLPKQPTKRTGTNVDRDKLRDCLNHLYFEVDIYNDLNQSDIINKMKDISQIDHSDSDCLLIAIMSHGKPGHRIYAHDGLYHLEKILGFFTDNNCPSLAGKPRLFFIQACQGNQVDVGILLRDGIETDGGSIMSSSIPVHADFLIAYSNIPGFASFRDPITGTWFIQRLCETLNENANKLDILAMLTFVCQSVAVNYESHTPNDPSSDHKKQSPCVTSMLTRILKFNDKV